MSKRGAPNKYYEALLLGKPLITTKGTIVGEKTEKYDTGWAIEENVQELKNLLSNLTLEEMQKKGTNAAALWKKEFENYIRNFFKKEYSKVIK